jgi:molybdopterin-guanine dinucleotide biosynthesis protein A
MTPFNAVVLAGRRAGVPGELADAHKVSDKCLIEIDGVRLIERVVGMLAATPGVGQIVVSVNDPTILRELPVCGDLLVSGRMIALPASENIAASVLDAT